MRETVRGGGSSSGTSREIWANSQATAARTSRRRINRLALALAPARLLAQGKAIRYASTALRRLVELRVLSEVSFLDSATPFIVGHSSLLARRWRGTSIVRREADLPEAQF